MGGGPADKMLQFLKLCGHSESFWLNKFLGENGGGPNTWPISGNFWILKIFTSV